jgi:hypothetical protein
MNWTQEQYNVHLAAKANTAKQIKGAKRGGTKKAPCEDSEQIALISWAHHQVFKGGRLSDYLFHIPNGGSRNIIEATKLKRMGVKAGVPDLQLIVAKNGYHGLWIELKAENGRLQQSQKIMIERLESQDYKCVVCFGFDEAKAALLDYLEV